MADGARRLAHRSWTDRVRDVSTAEWVALAAALTPLMVVCVWALAVGWVPLGDSGQLAVRSRDVFTANHPFIGAWSSSSQAFDTDVNNLGSLYSILLAPFTKIDPYGGTAVGVTAINAASVVAVWFASRSLLGRTGATVAMGATLVLVASMGAVSLLEVRQQIALLLPFWALMWTAAALWSGRWWAAPGVVFLASLVAQTHFTYLYQALALAVVGAVGAALAARRQRGQDWLAPALTAVAVGVICWVQPLWDQVFGQGNMAAVLDQAGRGGTLAPGWRGGAHLVSRAGLRYPFVLPGSMGDYRPFAFDVLKPGIGVWIALVVWFGAIASVIFWARSTRQRGLAPLAGIGLSALAIAWYVASRIPSYGPSFAAQNFYWMWPTALLVQSAVVIAIWRAVTAAVSIDRRVATRVVIVVLVAGALGSSVLTSSLSGISTGAFHRRAAARSFVAQVAAGLDALDIEGSVVIDYSRDSALSDHRYTFLAELQRRGQRFTFLADDGSTRRFGQSRCAGSDVRHRLYLVTGKAAVTPPVPSAVLIARVDATPQQYRELNRLNHQAGRLIRSGDIAVDVTKLAKTHRDAALEVARVRGGPNRAAIGIGPTLLFDASFFDAVEVSDAGLTFLQRWTDAQREVWADRAAMFVAPEADSPPAPPCP